MLLSESMEQTGGELTTTERSAPQDARKTLSELHDKFHTGRPSCPSSKIRTCQDESQARFQGEGDERRMVDYRGTGDSTSSAAGCRYDVVGMSALILVSVSMSMNA